MSKFDGRWFYCPDCDSVAIRCPHCRSSSCSGGGCDKCKEDFDQVDQMFAEGTVPQKDEVPGTFGLIGYLDLAKDAEDVEELVQQARERVKKVREYSAVEYLRVAIPYGSEPHEIIRRVSTMHQGYVFHHVEENVDNTVSLVFCPK